MGSLLTALASYLDVKCRGGDWFVRIDDIDPPRQDPNATRTILDALDAHGLTGDRPVDYQSQHTARYEAALERLASECFYCRCSRRDLRNAAVYPGTCRACATPRKDAAVRLRVRKDEISFTDGLLGKTRCRMEETHGDYIIKRRDGLWAYHLATAVDDGHDVSHVLRGQDLFDSTPVHIDIMRRLGLSEPTYTHLPLLAFADGSKLSKQTHAPAVDLAKAAANLRQVLVLLGQNPPDEAWPVGRWLDWGRANWRLENVPRELPVFTQNP